MRCRCILYTFWNRQGALLHLVFEHILVTVWFDYNKIGYCGFFCGGVSVFSDNGSENEQSSDMSWKDAHFKKIRAIRKFTRTQRGTTLLLDCFMICAISPPCPDNLALTFPIYCNTLSFAVLSAEKSFVTMSTGMTFLSDSAACWLKPGQKASSGLWCSIMFHLLLRPRQVEL